MPIVYSVIAQTKFSGAGAAEIVAEVQTGRGDFSHVVEVILERSTGNTKKSYFHEGYTFNYIVENGSTFLCVSDKDFPTRICFSFLEKLKEEYDGKQDFEQRMGQWMEYYSTNPAADKIRSVANSIEMVKTQMLDNLQGIVKRGDAMEDVLNKTDQLVEDSSLYRRKAVGLKRNMYFKNMKLTVVILLVLLIALLVFMAIMLITLVIIVCGFADLCTGDSSN